MADDALELRGVTVAYGDAAALVDVQLGVARGEMLALLGPSGSGKSTLLRAVGGLLAPSAGEIWLAGRRVTSPSRLEPPERRGVAMVFQNYALWPHLNALDTVAFPMRRRGLPRAQARDEARGILERLQIAGLSDRFPAQLSGGEQQRVGLGRALARNPSLYLFDEPTAHLDAHVRAVFLEELLRRRRETGAAGVYATHDAEEALGVADRVALLASGHLVQVGTPQEVYRRPVDLWAARLTGPASLLDTASGAVIVRPEWVRLGGERAARVAEVLFRGPHSDYLLQTDEGQLMVREPGPPRLSRGDETTWTLLESWPVQLPS